MLTTNDEEEEVSGLRRVMEEKECKGGRVWSWIGAPGLNGECVRDGLGLQRVGTHGRT